MGDVAHTLVGSFRFIWDLLDAAPIIDTLILGQDYFISFEAPDNDKTYNLKEIVLNHTNLTDDNIQVLFKALPKLEKIDVSFISPSPSLSILSSHEALNEIHIDGLKISDFDTVSKALGKLPNLTLLSLSNNEISKLEAKSIVKGVSFCSLQTLLLKSNKIDDVFALDGLMNLPKLEDLSLQRNPFQEKIGEIEARMIIVVRFPSLKKLNGSNISPSELYQSEIQYLEYYAKDVAKNGASNHQRWDELVKKFGPPSVPTDDKPNPNNQKKKASIKFIYGDKTIEKTIPLSMKIGLLSSRIPKLFKTADTEIELAIETGNYKAYLPYPDQTLAEVGCTDGSIIYAGPKGEHLIDETEQAISFKIRSISEHIETNDD